MKISVLPFAVLAHQVVAQGPPILEYDPNTAKDCIAWHDNYRNKTCEDVRSYWGITPEMFHEWNPSVGLDCKPWLEQSYCIVTQGRLDNDKPATTPSSVVTTTTSASSLAPSPTAWDSIGCYAQDPNLIPLEQKMTPEGDADLTIPKCEDICYRNAYRFAGVQQGDQCWCGNSVTGEWTRDQKDCNMPCSGDRGTICGGKEVLSVFEALKGNLLTVVSTTTSTTEATVASNSDTQSQDIVASSGVSNRDPVASSGAVRNKAPFGFNF